MCVLCAKDVKRMASATLTQREKKRFSNEGENQTETNSRALFLGGVYSTSMYRDRHGKAYCLTWYW